MKNLLLLFASILTFPLFAQFEINDVDFATVGDSVIYAIDSSFTDDLNNLDIVGDSAEWDFSELGIANEDTVFFLNPADISGGASFSSATFGYRQGLLSTFMDVNVSDVSILGVSTALSAFIDTNLLDTSFFGGNIPTSATFKYKNGGLFYLDLPAEYGDSDGGTAEGSFTFYYGDSIMGFYADSIRIKEDVTYDSEIDGAGVLKIPDGEYYAVRQNVWYTRTYSIGVGPYPFIGYLDVLPNVLRLTEHTYRFFGDYQKFPIVEINTDSAGTFNISRFQTQPPGSQVGVNEVLQTDNYTVRTFPTHFAIELNTSIVSFEVYNAVGQQLEEGNVSGNQFDVKRRTADLHIIKAVTNQGDVMIIKLPGK